LLDECATAFAQIVCYAQLRSAIPSKQLGNLSYPAILMVRLSVIFSQPAATPTLSTELRLCSHSVSFLRATICYSAYKPRQFRPSVTRVLCVKTAEHIIEILSLSDRPIILVFGHQGPLRKSDGFNPIGGAEYKGVAIFEQYAAISRKR